MAREKIIGGTHDDYRIVFKNYNDGISVYGVRGLQCVPRHSGDIHDRTGG